MSLMKMVGKILFNARAGEKSLLRYERGIQGAPETITVTSPAFANGSPIPAKFSKKGGDVFPPLAWANLPDGTRETVLVVEDIDARTPDHPFVHAIIYGLPPETNALGEGSISDQSGATETWAIPAANAPGCKMGRNTFGKDAWMGPDPIPGHGPHHYCFQLFALQVQLAFEGTVTRRILLEAMRGHVLAVGELIGTFERN